MPFEGRIKSFETEDPFQNEDLENLKSIYRHLRHQFRERGAHMTPDEEETLRQRFEDVKNQLKAKGEHIEE